ncbi:AI-2E family transporter [Microbacterium phyllosphaerae]|uniref:AI-2E family transporter n=1 Tax=Microbacterium phyllosphaerae TaxID=124798 RepID=UPI0021697DB3|nr:AI-2E family transporter [Microbacterium phyllosphaerae]MCS3444441.1 putative PurR-regulated permease PerM [Microbacterium phyllosphaerae]
MLGLFRRPEPFADGGASPRDPGLWSRGLGLAATRSLQTLAVLALVAVAVLGITQLSLVFIPVTIALILASAIHPLVSFMRRRGVPSILATWISLIGILAILGGIVWVIVLTVRSQWDDLVDSATDGITQVTAWLNTLPFDIDAIDLDDVWASAGDFLTSASFGRGALAGVSATASFFTGLALMIVVLFFFLKDGPRIWEFLLRPFTGTNYERARRIGDKTVDVFGGYIRGTSIVAAADAIGIGVGLAILQIPLALPLAVIVFLTAFIPLVGATAAGILAALVALVTHGPVAALIVVGIVVLVNQLEGNFLQPVVMARSLKLHALVILLALTTGTILGGIVGAVLSVPIAAVAWGIITVWDGPHTPARPFRKKRPEEV